MSYGCFLLENLIMYFWLCYDTSANLRHLDVVSAKTGLSPCGLNPVFVLKSTATRWCPRESTSVNLMKYLFI